MAEAMLVRYGEIALKGKNRVNFENKLVENIKKTAKCTVKRTSGRFVVYSAEPGKHIKSLRKVFGITSLSLAKETELDMDKIKEEALRQAKHKKSRTFRITVQRTQKRLKTSPELEREIGAYVVEKTGKKVKLKKPDLEIFIEIAEKAYIFTEKIRCFGGLPKGIEGNVALFFDEEIDTNKSILAGLLMMKRGCDVYPFLLKESDTELLEEYGSKKPAAVKNIEELEKEAIKKDCRAIAVGQTLDDFKEIKTGIVVLRPMIAFDNREIKARLGEFR